jgi:hypothetical protein
MRRLVLGLLISWQWTLGEAHHAKVAVSEREAERQWALSKTEPGGGPSKEWFKGELKLAKYLRSGDVPRRDQISVVRLGLLASRLAEWRVTAALPQVSQARIVAYYQANKHRLLIGQRRDIKAIINPSLAKVLEAKREMQAGVRFEKIAERFNVTEEGGLRLGRARGAAAKRYELDYFAAPPHVLVGPLKERLYYIFEVMSIKPRRQTTLAEAAPGIRQRLAAQDASTTLLKAYEQRWKSVTHCRAGYTAAQCERS